MNLGMQAALLLVLLLVGALSDGRTRWLYWWAVVVPAGFGAVYLLAWRRGERVRREGQWTAEWEKAEARRNYAWLAVVGVVFVVGALLITRFS